MIDQPDKPKKIATTIYLDEKLHFNAKIAALKTHTSLNKAVNDLLQKWEAEINQSRADGVKAA